MFDFLYQNKVLILILISFLILLIINIGVVYYYYTFSKEKKEEQKKIEHKEEQKKEEQKEEVKSSVEYIIYEYKVFLVLMVLLLLTTIDGIYYYNYQNEIALYILIFLIVLIILISIISILYYYYDNTGNTNNIDKDQAAKAVDAEIIKSLEEGPLEKRKEVLLNFLDKKFDSQGVPTGIFYLTQIKTSKRIELYKNIELKYIEKISIEFKAGDENKYLIEMLNTLNEEDETLLYTNLREKNIFLNTERDIIGSKLKNLINLLNENKDETKKEAASKLCFEKSDSNREILVKELKKRNIYHKIVEIINNTNYENAACIRKFKL